jgi:PAS domain S-box-containing protein
LVFGWKKEEVIGKQLFEFITHPRNVETYKKNMKLFLDTSSKLIVGKTNDISVLNKEGEEFPISISVAPLESNGDQLFILFFRNITEVKKIVDDLRENEETLQFIIDNIGEGVLVVNHEHHVLLANDVANELYGVEQGTRMPVHLSDRFELYYPDGKTIFPSQYLPTTIALNGQISDDLYLVLWDPIEKIKKRVLVSGKPIFNDNKQIVAAVITIKDITKYVQLEDELRDSLSNYRKLIGFKKEEADKSEALKLKEEEEPKPNE